MKILKNVLGIIIVILVTHFSAIYIGMIYSYFFPKAIGGGGLFLVSQEFGLYLAGLTVAYSFSLFLLFTACSGKEKYWWMGILVLPALVFEIYFDPYHIYFPIILGFLGWLIGLGVKKLIIKLNN